MLPEWSVPLVFVAGFTAGIWGLVKTASRSQVSMRRRIDELEESLAAKSRLVAKLERERNEAADA